MTHADFEYDPERALWRPGRRSFLFLMGSAIAGTLIEPVVTTVDPIELGGLYDDSAMDDRIEYFRPPMADSKFENGWPSGGIATFAALNHHGLIETIRGEWHLSTDGELLWRRLVPTSPRGAVDTAERHAGAVPKCCCEACKRKEVKRLWWNERRPWKASSGRA